MNLLKKIRRKKKLFRFALSFALTFSFLFPAAFQAQTINQSFPDFKVQPPTAAISGDDFFDQDFIAEKDFRVEKTPVDGGAEIITIFAKLKGLRDAPTEKAEEVPLVSVLRDTLGDRIAENDRLRYVWVLSYTTPSLKQRAAAAIPFLYMRTTNKGRVKNDLPPAVIDLQPVKKDFWDRAFWEVFRNLILEDLALPVRAVTLQYRENARNYRRVSIARALAVLALYESIEGKKLLSDGDLRDIQARMMLSDQLFGSFVKNENLTRAYEKKVAERHSQRGQNWELLRQYSEAQNLYFEPLAMPDGSATHALVWTTQEDLAANKEKSFDGRFLNIKSPWRDRTLTDWKGYSETRWFDANNQIVSASAPNAKAKKMIPLALYGLDFPKIPVVLVDFRDQLNPKKREMSKRVLNDLTNNIFSVSRFNNVPYFVGNYLYEFVTGRRGMDINQSSRLDSYSQLKLLLSLNASLDPHFRDEIAGRLESVSLNPLENDLATEMRIARRQYENLMKYARRPDGLPAQIENERREEMTRLKHSGRQRFLYLLGRTISLGIYKHRENYTAELRAEMDVRRQLDYHERFLRETARDSAKPEVDSDLEAINRSLYFISQNGDRAQKKTAQVIARIFAITDDEQTRMLCLSSLHRISNPSADKALFAFRENQNLDLRWRDLSAHYLELSAKEKQTANANAPQKSGETNEN